MLESLLSQTLSVRDADRITVIGIDGPTASGKTTLANALASALKAEGVRTWIFQMDWTLTPRSERQADLAHLRKEGVGFEREAELHMRLSIVEEFLRDIDRFNSGNLETKNLTLAGLYSRDHGGKLEGHVDVDLHAGLIVIVEGHYTLRSTLDAYIDLNILLLADSETLIARKVDRVKSYRTKDDTVDYYWRIDLPSFQYHLTYQGCHADIIIETSNVDAFERCGYSKIEEWACQHSRFRPRIEDGQRLTVNSISKAVFPPSRLIDPRFHDALQGTVELLCLWDAKVSEYLRTSLSEIHHDLTEYAQTLLEDLALTFSTDNYSFTIDYSDTLHNVYQRKLPLSLGVSILRNGRKTGGAIIDVLQSRAELHIFWGGGYHAFSVRRELGGIESGSEVLVPLPTPEPGHFSTPIKVFTPTEFMIPSFIDGLSYHPIYFGREDENATASQILRTLMGDGGIWIQRFALFSEMSFFEFVFDCVGVKHVRAGSYLIGMRHIDASLRSAFRDFVREWRLPAEKQHLFGGACDAMDAFVTAERRQMRAEVASCEHFDMYDDQLFSQFLTESGPDIDAALDQLEKFLRSDNRLLRKRATQFILGNFPRMTLRTREIWDELPDGSKEKIDLESLVRLSPSILAELYLWLAIRGQPSAVLGANIYDIRAKSADCLAFLAAAQDEESAIVLQSSLNACGQREVDGDRVLEGYLRPEEGVKTFVRACVTAARNLHLLTGQEVPLYSIGLDHVSAGLDHPPGRAKRFLESALHSGQVTHAVLDGEALFQAKTSSRKEMKAAYSRMAEYAASLTRDLPITVLLDREICVGELSYAGRETHPYVPTADELTLFVDSYQSALVKQGQTALLSRPTLFVGNLGTTHHASDDVPPSVQMAVKWRDSLKNQNFVSPVLHGTTSTNALVLEKASDGCHKINVAGDFLQTLLQSLPQSISQAVLVASSPKKEIWRIRGEMDAQSTDMQAAWVGSIKSHAVRVMKSISSPKLTAMDVVYFRYLNYRFTDRMIKCIREHIKISAAHLRSSPSWTAKPGRFSVSMIEIPFEDSRDLAPHLWDQGIRNFHVDAGDGIFVRRSFSGIDKAKYLSQHLPNPRLHAHLMIQDPHLSRGSVSAVDAYIDAGCHSIGVHPRAFSNASAILPTLSFIRDKGAVPGIVIETHDIVNDDLLEIIIGGNLKWVIVMGVPIGYGGQLFQFSTLNTISSLRSFAQQENRDLLIEIDGGLTTNNLHLCRNAGADLFSGWSILKADTLTGIDQNRRAVMDILAQ